jgi:uncharacterized phiE125 gp8 family phage protein
MKLKPVCVTPPDAGDPLVTLAEAKAQVHVDHEDHDAYIQSLIDTTTAHLDGYSGILGRCLVTQTWRVALARWPRDRCIRLPFPNAAPTGLVYADADGVDQTLDAALWSGYTDALGGFVQLKKAFTAPAVDADRLDAIRVTFTAGYGAAADVPAAIKHAMKLMIGHFYENREEVAVGQSLFVAQIPVGADRLLAPYRCVGL